MNSIRGGLALVLISLLALGCGDEDESAQPATVEAPVVRPASVQELALDLSQQALPAQLTSADLFVASSVTLGTIAGGEAGLFVQGSGGFELLDETPVRGLVNLDGDSFLVGREDGLRIWDGALKGTTLDESVGEAAITALAAQGEDIWIATSDALFVLEADGLTTFSELAGVTSISAFAGSKDVLLRASDGLTVLRAQGDDWVVQSLDEEPVEQALPGVGDRIIGLDGDALVERIAPRLLW